MASHFLARSVRPASRQQLFGALNVAVRCASSRSRFLRWVSSTFDQSFTTTKADGSAQQPEKLRTVRFRRMPMAVSETVCNPGHIGAAQEGKGGHASAFALKIE